MGLSRSTTHRILKCLTEEGLVSYHRRSRKYEIGMLSYELGLTVTNRVLQLAPWTATADRIARRANVTTYLMRRFGLDSVCVHKAEARSVIRVIPVEVGQRRSLGVGAGATALLADLPDETVDRVIAAVMPDLPTFADLTPMGIRQAVAATRQTGFSESQGSAYRKIYGLGVGVRAHATDPDIAISIAAHAPDVDDVRISQWKNILTDEITRTRRRLAALR